jgi:hypothetical protein
MSQPVDDLIERLRVNDAEIFLPLLGQAADRIEAQAAELRTLRAERDAEVAAIVAWLRDTPVTGAYSSDIIGREYREEFANSIERREYKEPKA